MVLQRSLECIGPGRAGQPPGDLVQPVPVHFPAQGLLQETDELSELGDQELNAALVGAGLEAFLEAGIRAFHRPERGPEIAPQRLEPFEAGITYLRGGNEQVGAGHAAHRRVRRDGTVKLLHPGRIAEAVARVAADVGGEAFGVGGFKIGTGLARGGANAAVVFRVDGDYVHRGEDGLGPLPEHHPGDGLAFRRGLFAGGVHLVHLGAEGVHGLEAVDGPDFRFFG
jgi:hypothetical protein